jgi:hypothetical protein
MTSPHGAEPDPELQDYFDRYGRDLSVAVETKAASVGRARRPLIALALSGLAAAAITAWLLIGGGPGERLDVVSEARAALAPPGAIVHMVVTTTLEDASGERSSTVEQWSATDPPRWRLVQTLPPTDGVMQDADGNVIKGRQEFAYAAGEQRVYYAERDVLQVTTGFTDDGPAAKFPGVLGEGAEDLRNALDSGNMRDEGEHVVDGHTVRRLVSERGEGMSLRRWTYDVDPETFEPVQAVLEFGSMPDGAKLPDAHMRVDEFERIPLNDETAKLLAISTTPNTEVKVRAYK